MRPHSTVFIWLLAFSLWLPVALPQAAAVEIQCRWGYSLMECVGSACNALRLRAGLFVGGRKYNSIADLTTRPGFQAALPILRPSLGEISQMAEQSPAFKRALINVVEGLPKDQQAAVLTFIFKHPEQGIVLIRSLGEVGLLKKEVQAMSVGLAAEKTPEDVGKLFKERAADHIAQRIGNGGNSINRLFDVTERLDPSTSGAIFENWLTRYHYPNGIGRMILPTKGLAGTYTKTKVLSDNLVDNGAKYTIVEMKHLRTSQDFGEREEEQARNYYNLITNNIVYTPKGAPAGKTFGGVEYVFSSRAAAEKNAPLIRKNLGTFGRVFYLDRTKSALLEIPM